MALNRNSNVYTVIYAVVLTALVAVLLTVAAVGLKDLQDANAANEKKQQILSAVSEALGKEVTFTNAADIWSELKMDESLFAVDVNGNKLDRDSVNAFDLVAKQQFERGTVKEKAQLPVFVANINGKDYYIMCMYGAGLWDAIWGYIAVEADGSTIAGASFDHAGETAGLGAKIKDDPEFAKAFIGKQVFVDGAFAPVVVSKKNVNNKVDAITGATKTSDCVSVMVRESLKGYEKFLSGIAAPTVCPAEQTCCQKAEGECCGQCEQACEGQCENECENACQEACENVEPENN